MAMSWLWAGMVVLSVLCGAVNGRMAAVSAAALEGAGAAVERWLGMLGSVCLWMGVMELMERCGLAGGLARLLRPVLHRLLPQASTDTEPLAAVSANVDFIVAGDNMGPAKRQKAEKLGVKIIDETAFMAMIAQAETLETNESAEQTATAQIKTDKPIQGTLF